jgi:uncharacterized protein (TIGR02996 family)
VTIQATERALLEAVASDLDDDGPRLVYADWLMSQGRGWGDFIRTSLVEPNGKAVEKLLRAHAKDGLGAAYSFVQRKAFGFARGFPKTLSASASALVKCVDEVALRAPGARAIISGVTAKHLDALAPARAFRGGDLWVHELDDRGLEKLCAGDLPAAFAVLQLRAPAFGPTGVMALASCAAAATLEQLFVIDARIDLAPLLASTSLTSLSSLTAGTAQLTNALRTCRRSLHTLHVRGLDDFAGEDASLLAASPSAPTLSSLSLSRLATAGPSQLTREIVLDLVASLPALSGLWLNGFGIPGLVATELAGAIAPRRIDLYVNA